MIERISLTGRQHDLLQRHLYPGDGLEAVAVALCGAHRVDGNDRLVAHKLLMVPHGACDRRPDSVTWPSGLLAEMCVEADKKAMRVVKLHSHPVGARGFSATDDVSDRRIFASVFGWMTSPADQASMIMLPDGELIARAIAPSLKFERVPLVRRVGDEIRDADRFRGVLVRDETPGVHNAHGHDAVRARQPARPPHADQRRDDNRAHGRRGVSAPPHPVSATTVCSSRMSMTASAPASLPAYTALPNSSSALRPCRKPSVAIPNSP